ncbi:MAG: hypothetical protein WAL60_21660, partial [Candidatus Sulfotelmatobacter sp.]
PVLKTGTITGPHALPDEPLCNCPNNKERTTARGFAFVHRVRATTADFTEPPTAVCPRYFGWGTMRR